MLLLTGRMPLHGPAACPRLLPLPGPALAPLTGTRKTLSFVKELKEESTAEKERDGEREY